MISLFTDPTKLGGRLLLLLLLAAGILLAGEKVQSQEHHIVVETPSVETVSRPAPLRPLRINDKDLVVAQQVIAALRSNLNKEVPKIMQSSHMSVPRLQQVLNGIYLLALERQLQQKPPAGSLQADDAASKNYEQTKTEVAAQVEREFGGRASEEYGASHAVIEKSNTAAMEIFDYLQGQQRKAP